jgi:hypothetical protein
MQTNLRGKCSRIHHGAFTARPAKSTKLYIDYRGEHVQAILGYQNLFASALLLLSHCNADHEVAGRIADLLAKEVANFLDVYGPCKWGAYYNIECVSG